ncbi:MAG: hypothetical protein Q7J79_02515 [Gemmatimonadales bacterium]|nr:hypothetical protein [Gemmatimonadales bacterium]
MNTTNQIPATQNEEWGFWGTMNQHAAAAWPIALPAIAETTGTSPDAVRAFLDSRHGRHFADDVLNQIHAGRALVDAIRAATTQWMTWKINRHTAKDYGIPRGLPYLTGFVIHCEITELSDEESLAA